MKQPSFPGLKTVNLPIVSALVLLVAVLGTNLSRLHSDSQNTPSLDLQDRTALQVAPPAALGAGKNQQLTEPETVPQGLGKSDWNSIKAAYQAGRRKVFERAPRELVARSDSQQYRAEFDGRGFQTHWQGYSPSIVTSHQDMDSSQSRLWQRAVW